MEYRQVYFRIRSRYVSSEGWGNDKAAANAFHEEARQLFQSAGWTIEPGRNSSVCDTVVKGQQELYLHPMNFSGVILVDEIPGIEALLAKATTFRCQGSDCYERYLELSDEDYWTLLESQKNEITAAILKQYKTKRKDLYVVEDVSTDIVQRFTVRRLCDKDGNHNKANLYVSQLIEELIADGYLFTAHTKKGLGIRAATEKELRNREMPLVDKDYLSRFAG